MAKFTVTPAQLNSVKGEIENLNGRFNRILGELIETEESLNGQWEGEAKRKYKMEFKKDVEKMRRFHTTMTTYIYTLGNISRKYQTTEARNVNLIH